MIKVFTLNKHNKIELTQKELEFLLKEAWQEGYNSKNQSLFVGAYHSLNKDPVLEYIKAGKGLPNI